MDVTIFDMDGTLIDSMPGLTDLAVDVINRHFHLSKSIARREYLHTVGLPFGEQLAAIFPGIEARPSRVVAEAVYIRAKREVTLAAPRFEKVYQALIRSRKGINPTVLVSSTHKSLVEEVLMEKSMAGYFTHVYGYVDQGKEAQIYNFLAHNSPEPITGVYYGDSDEDYRIARVFGLDFIRVDKDGNFTA